MRKFLSVFLAVLMICSLVPVSAISADAEVTSDGFGYTTLDDGNIQITDYTGTATEVIIPSVIDEKPVTSIGEDAFYYDNEDETDPCGSITSITIPASITEIGSYAFEFAESLTQFIVAPENDYFSASEDGVLFNKDKTVLICYPCGKEDSTYTVPDGVTVIEPAAFEYTLLTSVTIPEGVTSFGDYAFAYSYDIVTVNIPKSVTSIGTGAFSYCEAITDIYYAGSEDDWAQITIGDENDVLTTASIHYVETSGEVEEVESGTYEGFDYTLYSDDTITITGYSGTELDITVPSEIDGKAVTAIGDSAFTPTVFDGTDIRESITSITIPASVTSIDDWAFEYAASLAAINVDAENTVYSSDAGVLFNKDKTVIHCYPAAKEGDTYEIPSGVTAIANGAFVYVALTGITIPEGVTSIGDFAFSSAYYLDSVVIPNTVTTIGEGAFEYCDYLTNITIPGSVTSIGANLLQGSAAFTDVYYLGTEDDWTNIEIAAENDILLNATIHYAIEEEEGDPASDFIYETLEDGTIQITGYQGSNTVINIPSVIDGKHVTSIGDLAFAGYLEEETACVNVTSITIPYSVTDIGEFAFEYCLALQGFNVSPNSSSFCTDGGILFSKDKTTLVCCPVGLYLYSYTIPDGVENIAGGAFEYTYLSDLTVPSSVRNIGDYCFFGTSIETITLPEGVETIGEGAFQYSSVVAAYFPKSLKSIGSLVFDSTSIAVIYFAGTRSEWDAITKGEDNLELNAATVICAETEAVDKSALQSKIDEAKAIEKGNYTDESFAALQTAITSAETVNADNDATQEDVDAAVAALTEAIKDLVENEIVVLNGDVNGDNKIDASDATLVLQRYAGIIGADAENYNDSVADLNGDGNIDVSDATIILQIYAGISSK